jgi:hypothetical protein
MHDFASIYFPNRHTFCMCNFVLGNKAQLALFLKTKLHIQKCNTCRDIEKRSRPIRFHNDTVAANSPRVRAHLLPSASAAVRPRASVTGHRRSRPRYTRSSSASVPPAVATNNSSTVLRCQLSTKASRQPRAKAAKVAAPARAVSLLQFARSLSGYDGNAVAHAMLHSRGRPYACCPCRPRACLNWRFRMS